MDFDFMLAGTEQEYNGKKYMYLKRVNIEYVMAVEIGSELPAPVVLIPVSKPQGNTDNE